MSVAFNSDAQILHETDAPLSPRFEPDFFKVTEEIKEHVPNNIRRLFVHDTRKTATSTVYLLEFGLSFIVEHGKKGGTWVKQT